MQYILGHCIKMGFKMNSRCLLRRMSHSKVQPLLNVVKEIEIKVPWGKIAAKLWGTENKQPILALHGWQDNAASFDTIAPYLLKNIPIMAIDFPGHGFSSWLPPGIMYSDLIYLMLMQRIKQYFGWDKMKIMAHSMAGLASFYYSSFFPNEVEYIIGLDAVVTIGVTRTEYPSYFSKNLSKLLEVETYANEIKYTKEEMMGRWISSIKNSIDEDTCKILMTRGVTEVEHGKYVFNRDPRLKFSPYFSQYTNEHINTYAKYIRCPCLFITAKDSYISDTINTFNNFNTMRETNENVYWHEVPGTHHIHMRDPENVSKIINLFLEKYDK
ncbi:probable serine hydrolase [Colletes gigas]|uniref:probable serine hydrolase n=1 Tax=Colletes gigas TaxID=935657 RepID=UPI001C9B0B13|nr:probable serine hydrolase [Colletes gigas]